MALKDIRDRAFKLSNELLGAYDAVSVLGKDIRQHMIPFWSFTETNMRRYIQLFKNAAQDDKLAEAVGRKLIGTAIVRTPYIAVRVGGFAIRASAMWTLLQVWNYTVYPDEERELSPDVASRPHIVLGRDEKGDVRYFSRLGTISDFLEWFGLDQPAKDVTDYLNGRRTIKEIAVDTLKTPFNKLVSSVTPAWKTPAELAAGMKFYPDVTKPSRIRDRWDYLAQSLGLEKEYRALAGKPSPPYAQSLKDIAVFRTDPNKVAYSYIQDEKRRFLKSIGKESEGFMSSPRGEALYNYKLALRYKDEQAAGKYLEEYMILGGSAEGFQKSLESMSPLAGLNESEQVGFFNSLREEDKDQLSKAFEYYNTTLMGL
jgi:hypothetical protein